MPLEQARQVVSWNYPVWRAVIIGQLVLLALSVAIPFLMFSGTVRYVALGALVLAWAAFTAVEFLTWIQPQRRAARRVIEKAGPFGFGS
jgi:hypothetical protein